MEGITEGEEVLMKPDKHVMQNLAMITQVGISMLAPIVLCVWAGVWLDEHFGWSTTVVLLILGHTGRWAQYLAAVGRLAGTDSKQGGRKETNEKRA